MAPNKNKRAKVRETLETHSDCVDTTLSELRLSLTPKLPKGSARPGAPHVHGPLALSQTLDSSTQVQSSYCKYRSPERVRKERERYGFSVYEPQQVWRLLEEQLDSAVIISPLPPATRTQNR